MPRSSESDHDPTQLLAAGRAGLSGSAGVGGGGRRASGRGGAGSRHPAGVGGTALAAAIALVALLLAAPPSPAAPPVAPDSIPYQGLLVDGLGQPRTGNVDLVVRIFDSLLGGTLVYKQSFSAVALTDGVFTVQLGPTGDATDSPSDPLTTSLATALGGDAGPTAAGRFVELTVGTDGALARTQILASAYALRARSAASADTATTATTANDVTNVGGVGASFVTQIFQHYSWDGGDPPNDDPREGLADVDGDGLANFIDPDNDNDGYSDVEELANGTSINLVTPKVVSITPASGYYTDPHVVTVVGTGFVPPLSVVFGSQTPVASNVLPGSFNVTVGPQAPGTVGVTVTNSNGESASKAGAFDFTSSTAYTLSLSSFGTTIAARPGTGEVVVGGVQEYGIGTHAEQVFPLASASAGKIAMAFAPSGALAALRCRSTSTSVCALEILVDSDADNALEEETGIPVETLSASPPEMLAGDLAVDPAGHWVAGYIRRAGSVDAVVAHDRNGDGDFDDPNERVTIESSLGSVSATPSELAVDSTGHVALVYRYAWTPALHFAWDRNGDGDFADTISGNPEMGTLGTGTVACLGATFDGSDHLVVVWSNGSEVRLARDTNGDGDFADPGEDVALATGSADACDVAYAPGQPLAVMHDAGGLKLLLDKNGDGDFADAGESTSFPQAVGPEAQLALNGADTAFIAAPSELIIATTE
jgi:hypothetical protein